jgi:hypothetical protein
MREQRGQTGSTAVYEKIEPSRRYPYSWMAFLAVNCVAWLNVSAHRCNCSMGLCLPCRITAPTAPPGASRSALWPPCCHLWAASAREGRDSVPCCSLSPLHGPGHPCTPTKSSTPVALRSSPSSGPSSRSSRSGPSCSQDGVSALPHHCTHRSAWRVEVSTVASLLAPSHGASSRGSRSVPSCFTSIKYEHINMIASRRQRVPKSITKVCQSC